MKRIIFLGLLLAMGSQLVAQLLDYRQGYIIDKDSVKTECLVKYISDGGISTKPLNKENGKKQTYTADEILGYGTGYDHYVVLKNVRTKVSTNIGNSKQKFIFAKVELKGKINLYSTVLRSMSSGGYGFNYEEVFILEKLPEYPAVQLRKSKKKQLALLNELVKDSQEASKKMGTKKLRESEIKQLIRFYNNADQTL
ncbi:hypothetical protein KEM09_13795 [Carboxylicivirga mesophila]|uniref:DUF4468 domain-containing protein n=1 Tax=Carboxylicivirga mesophila TaxID=1166478 RepID=A0ABS5KBR6_9BACT|nr:hypothetical protein [Carboxylicivirga mesophila]MBS2212484.1 hypothetical protein [Carboxylicivirga mesophila]